MTATLLRTESRTALPEAGTWSIDPRRAVVAFSGRTSFLTPTISARFQGVTGMVRVGDAADDGSVDVEVDVTTLTTGNRSWDDVIATFDPFDAQRHPVATYRSTAVTRLAGEIGIEGELTLRGVTRRIGLTASYDVGARGDRMLVRAGGTIDREQFGVRFDVPGLGKIIPRTMRLEIDVDVTR